MNTAGRIASFLNSLDPDLDLPGGISLINPYPRKEVKEIVKKFTGQFYKLNKKRILILGINPGRFGGGVTGISFTDPIALEEHCGISNTFAKKHELSSRFIYEVIGAFGGTTKFYNEFILSAVCPLGFLQGIKNHNYYDSKQLLTASGELIIASLKEHARWNVKDTIVVSLGKKNASCLEAFNRELKLFEKIIILEHPRYIMQYRSKSKQQYIDHYCNVLSSL